jgi:hypothetical protein
MDFEMPGGHGLLCEHEDGAALRERKSPSPFCTAEAKFHRLGNLWKINLFP